MRRVFYYSRDNKSPAPFANSPGKAVSDAPNWHVRTIVWQAGEAMAAWFIHATHLRDLNELRPEILRADAISRLAHEHLSGPYYVTTDLCPSEAAPASVPSGWPRGPLWTWASLRALVARRGEVNNVLDIERVLRESTSLWTHSATVHVLLQGYTMGPGVCVPAVVWDRNELVKELSRLLDGEKLDRMLMHIDQLADGTLSMMDAEETAKLLHSLLTRAR